MKKEILVDFFFEKDLKSRPHGHKGACLNTQGAWMWVLSAATPPGFLRLGCGPRGRRAGRKDPESKKIQ